MPKEYSTKFKTEVIKRYQNGESSWHSVRNCVLPKARSTIGEKSFAPSKQQIVFIHRKSLMRFRGGWKNWSMKWRSLNDPVTSQMYRCRKSCPF